MKIDPYKNKELYERWKQKGFIPNVSDFNSKIIVEYLGDMELGLNVTKPSGFINLNKVRNRMGWIARQLEKDYARERMIDITEREIVGCFKYMRDGKILTRKGKPYTSVHSYAKVFQAFWHWYQKVEKKKDNTVEDVVSEIDTRPVREPGFVYFEVDDVKKLAAQANFNRRALIWFLFDSGIRAPTELVNVRVDDLTPIDSSEFLQLHIRDEISKTIARKIKLLLCSKILQDYIAHNKLKAEDYLFPICPGVTNQYLKRLVKRVLGDVKTKGGEKTDKITMYDFRHCSACYWRPRYKKNWDGFKYRFGWTQDDMPNYYTKFLGMKDTITEDDLLIDGEAKTKLEKELEKERKDRNILEEELQAQREEMAAIRKQLARNEARDIFIGKLIKSLQRNGKIGAVVDVIEEENLVEELTELA